MHCVLFKPAIFIPVDNMYIVQGKSSFKKIANYVQSNHNPKNIVEHLLFSH